LNKLISIKKLTIMFLLAIILISATGASFQQSGAAMYVDGSAGNDNNSGTSTGSAFRTIQKAANMATAGTIIYVRGGTYNESIALSRSGSSGAPITLTRYGSESVTINGGSNMAIYSSGAVSYWTIDSLTIRSTNRYTMRFGWYGEPTTDHFTVKNNTIFGADYIMGSYHIWDNNNISGVGYPGGDGDGGISDGGSSHHNIYRNNNVHDFTGTDARGIWTQGQSHDNLIENNVVTNINTGSGLGQCIDLDGAAQIEWRHVVRGNRVSGCSYVGIQLENVFDTIIENNVITGGNSGIIVISYDAGVKCLKGGESGQYGDQNGDNNCQGDPTNNSIRQNLITTTSNWGWGYGGIVNWYAGAVKYWGNTISAPASAGNGGINVQGTAAQNRNTSIKSNIITQGSGAAICASDWGSISEDSNNLLYRTSGTNVYTQGSGCSSDQSLSSYQSSTGRGQNNLVANPNFKSGSDFSLASNSPAIDTGVTVGTTSDIVGNSRPANVTYDMGAYEFGGTPTVPTAVPTAGPTVAPTTAPTVGPTTNLAFGKPATQSSTYENGFASLAEDGNLDGNYYNGSVSHTGADAMAWWQVDLGASSNLSSIDLYPRTDCCTDTRNLNMYVLVSDNPIASTDLNTAIAQAGVSNFYLAGPVMTMTSINVNRSGRYIRVQLAGTNNLSLTEVVVKPSGTAPTATTAPTAGPTATKAPTNAPTAAPTLAPTTAPTTAPGGTASNIARGKTASQSSTYSGAAASRAVDGNTDGNFNNGSVTHTNADAGAWWALDLGASSQITNVNLWARTDCCEWRTNNVYLLVSDSPITSTALNTARAQAGVSSYLVSGNMLRPSTVAVNRTGRYIRVQLQNSDNLSLAEVEVMGTGSAAPTTAPTVAPTAAPTATKAPTTAPTAGPTATKAPTTAPTTAPTATKAPTTVPTTAPTVAPTTAPTTPPSGIINVGKGKTATQSSDYNGAAASRAVDGNTDGNFNNGSVTHTNADAGAWWQVDLGASYTISYLNLWARSDCCEWRSNNVYVLVSDTAFTSTNLSTTRSQAGVSSYLVSGNVLRPSKVDINRTGRYIRVQLQNTDNLSLAEMEVMANSTPVVVAAPMMLQAAPAVVTVAPTAAPVIVEPTAAPSIVAPTAAPAVVAPTQAPTATLQTPQTLTATATVTAP
jgi:hypothetical protein